MSDVTRGEIDAKLAAAAAETDTKFARLEGKLDLVISKIEDARAGAHSDNVATRANVWIVFAVVVAIIAALYAFFPVFFDFGSKVQERIADEIKARFPTASPAQQSPAPPSPAQQPPARR
jgi:hypothetical protein